MSAYILTREAQNDWYDIVEYTIERFGEKQMIKYTERLENCIEEAVSPNGIYKELLLHDYEIRVIKCQKHYIFIYVPKNQTPSVLSILHERMDWMTRFSERLGFI